MNYKVKSILVSLLAIVMAFSGIAASQASKVYDNAIDLMVGGKYSEAADLFDSIAGYEDASRQAMYCKTLLLAEEGEYDKALNSLKFLGDYKDCDFLYAYYSACQAESMASSDPLLYLDAADYFSDIELFRDSSSRAINCKQKLYDIADDLLVTGSDYSLAAEYFDLLGDFSNSQDRSNEAHMFYSLQFSFYPSICMPAQSASVLPLENNTIHIDDLEENQCFGVTLEASNSSYDSYEYIVSVEIDDESWTFSPSTIDSKGMKKNIIIQSKHSEPFEIGLHTCKWYVNQVLVAEAVYEVLPGHSSEKQTDMRLMNSLEPSVQVGIRKDGSYSGDLININRVNSPLLAAEEPSVYNSIIYGRTDQEDVRKRIYTYIAQCK